MLQRRLAESDKGEAERSPHLAATGVVLAKRAPLKGTKERSGRRMKVGREDEKGGKRLGKEEASRERRTRVAREGHNREGTARRGAADVQRKIVRSRWREDSRYNSGVALCT